MYVQWDGRIKACLFALSTDFVWFRVISWKDMHVPNGLILCVYSYQLESYVCTQLAEQSINKRAIYVLNQLISCVQSDQLESYVPKSLVYALLWSFAGDAKMKVNNI